MADLLSNLHGPRTWFDHRSLILPRYHGHLLPLNPFLVSTISCTSLRPFKSDTSIQRLLTACSSSRNSSGRNSVSSDIALVSSTVHTDGSVLFRFGKMDEIDERDEPKKDNHTNEVPGNDSVSSLAAETAEKLKLGDDSGETIVKQNVNKVFGNSSEGEIESPAVGGQGNNSAVIVDVSDVDIQRKGVGVHDGHLEPAVTDDVATADTNITVHVVQEGKNAFSCAAAISSVNDVQNEETSIGADGGKEVSIEGEDVELEFSTQLEIFPETTACGQNEYKEVIAPSQLGVISDSSKDKSEEAVEENVEAGKDEGLNLTEDLTCSHGGDKDEVVPRSNSLKTEPVLNEELGYIANDLYRDNKIQNSELMIVSELSDVDKMTRERSDSKEASSIYIAEFNETVCSGEKVQTADTLCLSSGAASLPHPSKASSSGEDAYFFTPENWLGVADGVSQWSLEGTSPGVFAQELIENCKMALSNQSIVPKVTPAEILCGSAAETVSPGLSTILLGYFDGNTFHVANIGDSGFIVIRDGAVFDKSNPMVHEFNFPVLMQRGDNVLELMEVYKIDLNEGDVIVTATDGLLDNLYGKEITSIVSELVKARRTPQEIAEQLAMKAQEVGRLASSRSPFADAAQAAGHLGYTGGKLDDVTVLVSVVQKTSSTHL